MKLDEELVRDVLLQVEASTDPLGWVELDGHGHSYEEVAYHVEKLNEGGFLHADELTSSSGYDWKARQLTYEGHEFLDTVRDPEIWRLTKEAAKKAGVSSAKALFEVGKHYAKQKLIEHGKGPDHGRTCAEGLRDVPGQPPFKIVVEFDDRPPGPHTNANVLFEWDGNDLKEVH